MYTKSDAMRNKIYIETCYVWESLDSPKLAQESDSSHVELHTYKYKQVQQLGFSMSGYACLLLLKSFDLKMT